MVRAPPTFEPAPQYKVSTTQTTEAFSLKERAQPPVNEDAIHHLDEPTKPEMTNGVLSVKSKAQPPSKQTNQINERKLSVLMRR